MALPFMASRTRRPDQILAIDLGGKTTKAVHVQRKGESFTLSEFCFLDAPAAATSGPPEEHMAAHLKNLLSKMEHKSKQVSFALGVDEAFLKHAEIPSMVISDMRQLLKGTANSQRYLQEKYEDYLFDCFVLPPKQSPGKPGESSKPAGQGSLRTLVAGARRKQIETIQAACKASGLTPICITPGMIGPVNAFEFAVPEVFSKEIVALVDIGARQSTITILLSGELALYRQVASGGDRITAAVAEALNTNPGEAEGLKVGLSEDPTVQAAILSTVSSLGRDFRASIDFFESHQDKTVSQVFISGGSARSQLIVENLQSELMVACKGWNPTGFMNLGLSPSQRGEIEQVAPQLAVAVGAAMTVF